MTVSVNPEAISGIPEQAQMSCPFDFPGIQPHDSGQGLVVRFWRPDVIKAILIQLPQKKPWNHAVPVARCV